MFLDVPGGDTGNAIYKNEGVKVKEGSCRAKSVFCYRHLCLKNQRRSEMVKERQCQY
jgi:hypothetical protein